MNISAINLNCFPTSQYLKQNRKNLNFAAGKAVYAGSFDPITNGHLDLIKEASELFDDLVVLVAKNPKKQGFIPIEKRIYLIQESVKDLKNVKVDTFEELTVKYAKLNNAKYLLRGMRTVSDFDSEMQTAKINEILNPELKTVFMFSSSDNSAISSSVVREILANKSEEFVKFVPKPVADYLMDILNGKI